MRSTPRRPDSSDRVTQPKETACAQSRIWITLPSGSTTACLVLDVLGARLWRLNPLRLWQTKFGNCEEMSRSSLLCKDRSHAWHGVCKRRARGAVSPRVWRRPATPRVELIDSPTSRQTRVALTTGRACFPRRQEKLALARDARCIRRAVSRPIIRGCGFAFGAAWVSQWWR